MWTQADGESRCTRLTYGIPNLQFDLLAVNGHHPGAKLDADGQVVHRLEALVGELQQQTRLADACGDKARAMGRSCPVSVLPIGVAAQTGARRQRTSVANDDVLEQVRVRHFRTFLARRRRLGRICSYKRARSALLLLNDGVDCSRLFLRQFQRDQAWCHDKCRLACRSLAVH